jgi:hypothetical protein
MVAGWSRPLLGRTKAARWCCGRALGLGSRALAPEQGSSSTTSSLPSKPGTSVFCAQFKLCVRALQLELIVIPLSAPHSLLAIVLRTPCLQATSVLILCSQLLYAHPARRRPRWRRRRPLKQKILSATKLLQTWCSLAYRDASMDLDF